MSDNKFNRTVYSSKSGKLYMVFHDVKIPEFTFIPELKGDITGVVLNNMHSGEIIVLSYSNFHKNFSKVEEYTYKNHQDSAIDVLLKGKIR